MRWHFLRTPPADGAANMALDEALMHRARRTGDAIFRVYGWSSPVLSLGRNQRARGCYDGDVAAALGVSFVRRPTGGRALLHRHEVTYSATMPCDGPAAAATAYHFINEVLLGALTSLGVPARQASVVAAVAPGPRPCFDVPSAHEIVVDDHKLVGSAQWRHDGALLQHGSILVRDDQALIARIMREPQTETPIAATVAGALGREPTTDEVAGRLLESLRATLGQRVGCMEIDAELEAAAAALGAVYTDDSWTWRR